MLGIIGGFNFQFPPSLKALFSLSNIISTLDLSGTTVQLQGAFQCMIYQRSYPVSVNKLIGSLGMVICGTVGIVVFLSFRWLFRSCSRRNKAANFNTRKVPTLNLILISIIMLFYLMYENLFTSWLKVFSCTKFTDNTYPRLIGDYDIPCWTDNEDKMFSHKYWLTVLALPVGIILIAGLPIAAFLRLWSLSKQFTNPLDTQRPGSPTRLDDDQEIEGIYGFLYNGYKKNRWYWEVVTTSKKIMLAFVSVFLPSRVSKEQGLNRQGLVALFILQCLLGLQLQVQPYVDDDINQLETFALLVSTLSVYLGLWTFITINLEWQQNLIAFTVLFLNFAFGVLFMANLTKGGVRKLKYYFTRNVAYIKEDDDKKKAKAKKGGLKDSDNTEIDLESVNREEKEEEADETEVKEEEEEEEDNEMYMVDEEMSERGAERDLSFSKMSRGDFAKSKIQAIFDEQSALQIKQSAAEKIVSIVTTDKTEKDRTEKGRKKEQETKVENPLAAAGWG